MKCIYCKTEPNNATTTPFKCARIYYPDNKSRLVPLDRLEIINE